MIANPMGVRRAMPDDLPALTESATMITLEGALQAVSKVKVAVLAQRCVERDRAIAGIIDGPSGIEASIGMAVESFDYSDEEHLSVKWLGVHPAFRRQNHGALLLQFAQWAQEVMAVPLFIDLSTTEALQAKMHLYLRMVPQVGARFSWGGVPEGAFSQSRVGEDPFEDRKRSRRTVSDARKPAIAAA